MKLPAYPHYKPSGVEWLGDLPEHWDVKRLKYSASINDEALPETTPADFDFEYVDIGGVNAVDGITGTEELVFENAPSRARRVVRHGDTIVSTVRTYLRAIAPIKNPPENLIVSTGFAVVRPRRVDSAFLAYALRESSFVESVVSRSVGVSYPAVNASEVGRIPISLPDLAEQQAIANFLDRETGRVGRLVAKKQELIERLKEKRTALISRTVTRGLRNKEIVLLRLRRILDGIDTGLTPNSYNFPAQEGQAGVLKSGCVNGGLFDPNENKLLAEDVDPPTSLEVKAGDILMSRASGSSELIGSVAHVRKQPAAKLYLSDKTFRLRVNKAKYDEAFLVIVMGSNYLRNQLSQIISGAQGLAKNIAQSDMRELLVPSPPLDEQQAIATYLERETSKIDRMVAKVEEAIERLQEYRAALITAAVTGKIDVRRGPSI